MKNVRIAPPWSEKRLAGTVIIAGILVRLATLGYINRFPLASDSLAYHEMGMNMARGVPFSPLYPPGISFFLAFAFKVFGSSELVSRLSGLAWYLVFIVLVFSIARRSFGRVAAVLAVSVFSFFPAFIWHSTEPLTQLPTATLLLGIGLALISMREKHAAWEGSILGALLGLAILVRPSNLFLSLVVLVYVLVVRRRRLSCLVAGVVALSIVSCWLISARNMTGRFVPINEANGMNVFYGNDEFTPLYKTWWFGSHGRGEPGVPKKFSELLDQIERMPAGDRSAFYRKAVISHVTSRFDLFVVRTVNRVCTFLAFDTFTGSALRKLYGVPTSVALLTIGVDALFYSLVVLSCLLFVFSSSSTETERDVGRILLLIAGAYAIPYWLSFSHPTYHVPVVPLLGVVGSSFVARVVVAPGHELLALRSLSRYRRVGLLCGLGVFVLIQIEWIVFGLSRI